MQFRSTLRFLLLVATGAFFFGCSSDLDVTAPYKEITVVYSLLNKNDNIHWVKINKAFLGDGDAFVYAQIADSTEYTEAQLTDAHVEKVDADGNVIQSIPLQDTILTDRPEGIFTWPAHKMYFFRGDQSNGRLDVNYRYRIVANAKGNHVEAITQLVNDVTPYATTNSSTSLISFRQNNAYQSYPIKWETTLNGRRYEAYYRFSYDEVRTNGDIFPKHFDTFVGSVISSSAPGQVDQVSLSGELFFQTVATRVAQLTDVDEGLVQKRIFRGVEFFWWVAAPELHTYLQLANPISGIVEERPDYSNVTGGYGLFSSRMYKIAPDLAQGDPPDISKRKKLEPQSVDELENGPYTAPLHFCVPPALDLDC